MQLKEFKVIINACGSEYTYNIISSISDIAAKVAQQQHKDAGLPDATKLWIQPLRHIEPEEVYETRGKS